MSSPPPPESPPGPHDPIGDQRHGPSPTQIFLRGLAASLPAILTIVILLWVLNGLNSYIIQPATWTVKYLLAQSVSEAVPSDTLRHIDAAPPLDYCDSGYVVTEDFLKQYQGFLQRQFPEASGPDTLEGELPEWAAGQQRRIEYVQTQAMDDPPQVFVQLGEWAVPYRVYAKVAQSLPPGQVPTSARAVYMEYVASQYLTGVVPLSVLTIFLLVALLYFVGRFVSARVGRWIFSRVEDQILGRLPVVRNVYGSVKQVTDFVFSEKQQVEYRRVVAVQYPREGVYTVGFVTGESFLEIALSAGEPCVAVLIPTSPMPMTGFTISVPRSEIIDLNITVEQAMQFCISCGVLTPAEHKLTPELMNRLVNSGQLKNTASKRVNLPAEQTAPPATGLPRGAAS
ncbi:MAG: DUF502 domain-containing protein [Planctomycetaceae bacterium]|nr:DUF502 domain-containing protein [Planctomycetaceae bacterium]